MADTPRYITASRLYDYLQCPHRVWRDIYGPQNEKSTEVNPFVKLLWDRGVQHEKDVIKGFEVLDIATFPQDQRFDETMKAMEAEVPLLYQGVLIHGDNMGIPDLLRRNPDGSYTPVDIKSGAGREGVDEKEGDPGSLKEHYAAQLCHYTRLLQLLGFRTNDTAYILDISSTEVPYPLDNRVSKTDERTWWQFYDQTVREVEALMKGEDRNYPAISSTCGLCPWNDSCRKWAKESEDPTLLFSVGRNARDRLARDLGITTVEGIIDVDVEAAMEQKKAEKKDGNKDFLYMISDNTLEKAKRRARIMLRDQRPVALERFDFPKKKYELYFDIEDDPTQDFVYMHGLWIVEEGKEGYYKAFTARDISDDAEKQAWKEFWDFIDSLPQGEFSLYYYSAHEKSTYKRMAKRYPDIKSEEDVVSFFGRPNIIDLYFGVVFGKTDWPVGSYGIKAIATFLGFKWEDETPSGALSIKWFNEYIRTKDQPILERILIYNKNDCQATQVVKEAVEKMMRELP
jgi:predicted RecB family nuclease